MLQANATGKASVKVSRDAALIIVLAPAGGNLRREGKRTLIDGVVVRY